MKQKKALDIEWARQGQGTALAGLSVTWHPGVHKSSKKQHKKKGEMKGSQRTIRGWIDQDNPFTDKDEDKSKHIRERNKTKGRNLWNYYEI